MKRKIFAVGLSLVAAMTVVGAGFSSWYFAEKTSGSTEGYGIGFDITPASTSAGTLTADATKFNGNTIFLDQGTTTNAENELAGIYLGTAMDTATADAGIDFTYTLGSEDFTNLGNSGQEVTLTITIDINAAFSEYVTINPEAIVTGADSHTNTGNTQYVYKRVLRANTETLNVNLDYSNNVNTGLRYVEGKKPKDITAYKAMTSKLSNKSNAITITCGYAIAPKAA